MKKTLVALASMAALGAFAQSSVTMYGVVEATVDVGYKSSVDTRVDAVNAAGLVTTGLTTSNATTKAGFRVNDGNDQGVGTSRIGWRGTEDLGGGLKANFQLEMGLRVDDGCLTTGAGNVCSSGNSGGNVFGRNAWVGAAGGFGEVRLGRQVLGSFSTQANGWSAGSSNGLYDAGSTTAPAMGGVRFSNAIRYITPNMGGLTGSVMLAAPESTVTSNNGVAAPGNVTASAKPKVGFDLALDFANGPLYAGFGYNSRGSDNVNVTGASTTISTPTTAPNIKAYTFSAAYDLGVVKPFFNYTRQKTDSGSVNASTNSATFREDTAKAFFLGLRAPLGAATLIAGFGNNKVDGLGATGAAGVITKADVSETKTRAYQIGMQYPLSKRTLIEANYGQNKVTGISATANATAAGVATGGSVTYTTTKISAINIGLRHSF